MPRVVPVVALLMVCSFFILRESAGAEVRQERNHATLHIDALHYVNGHPSISYAQRPDRSTWQRRADWTLFLIGKRENNPESTLTTTNCKFWAGKI